MPIFVARLVNLHVTESLDRGDKISDRLMITNSRRHIEELIGVAYRNSIGTVEWQSLVDGSPIVFSEIPDLGGHAPIDVLNSLLHETQRFLMSSWIAEDNAINFENGHIFYQQGNFAATTSNVLSHQYSLSNGKRAVLSVSRDELRSIRHLHRISRLPVVEISNSIPTTGLTKDRSRLDRADYFLHAARSTWDVAIKIAHYCTALESLFSTSQAELSHQLSERVAFYLYQDPDERLECYRRTKEAYSYRSKVVHGSSVPENRAESVIGVAKYCDDVARKIFQRVFVEQRDFEIFGMNPGEFDAAMLKRIFGSAA